jgi:hypothetical protein
MNSSEQWTIWVAGYGKFNFDGTEAEAEEMRRHKANWEGGQGRKWRTNNQTEVDKLTEEIVGIWESGEGVPQSLMSRLHKAKNPKP